MDFPIKVNYKYTNNCYLADKWLNELPDVFAADFEVASKFTDREKHLLQYRLTHNPLSREEKRILRQRIESNGLSHPSLTVITHLSVAWSTDSAFVIICDSDSIRKLVTRFLVTTDKLQLWHNCGFDFKHIHYLQHDIPHHFVDTQLLAKSILNDADSVKGDTGLKSLMAYAYADWAMVRDSDFLLESTWNEDMIRYSATDACATYHLYQDILHDIGG